MRFQKNQPAGAATLVPHSSSTGPLKNMDASSPARKAHAHEINEKAGSISNTCELPWPVRDVSQFYFSYSLSLASYVLTYSPPDVKTGRGTPRSLYALLHLCMSLFCLLRVLLLALGRVLT